MQPVTKTALTGHCLPSQMLALEPRYLFDAAAAATVADTTSDIASNDAGSDETSSATSAQDSTQENATAFLTQLSAASTEADLAPDSQSFFIPENAADGSRAGFIATNPDAGEVTFTVTGGSGEEAFAVNPDSGEITVTDNSQLSYEDFDGPARLTLEVMITKDLGNGDTEKELVEATVFVGDVNEPPIVEPIENQVATVGETLTVQIVAYDADGDQLFYQIAEGPEGASIDANGLFTWTPTPDQETDAATTISIYVSDGPLGTSTTTVVDFNFDIERVNPINDTNNGDPSRSQDAINIPAARALSSDQIIDAGDIDEIVSKTVAKEIAVSDAALDVDMQLLAIAEIEDYGLEEMVALDTEVEGVQTLIAEGSDPTQITPSTAAGFSKQVALEAQSQTAETAEILAIMEQVTALLGCNR